MFLYERDLKICCEVTLETIYVFVYLKFCREKKCLGKKCIDHVGIILLSAGNSSNYIGNTLNLFGVVRSNKISGHVVMALESSNVHGKFTCSVFPFSSKLLKYPYVLLNS